MTMKQISVFIENQPGKLAELTSCLSAQKVNLRALSVSEAADFGIVRIIADDVFGAVTVLKNEGYICSLTDVLAVEVEDEPGKLAGLITALASAGINVEYMYAILEAKKDAACMVIRVNDNVAAEAVLAKAGF